MQATLVMILAVMLAPDATKVALDRNGWTVEKEDASHSVWWWSRSCAPQKLEDGRTAACGAVRSVRVRTAPNATVTWGNEAMLRDLPDDRLPKSRSDEQGFADVAVPAGQEIWMRAVTSNAASAWTSGAGAAGEIHLTTGPALPVRITLRGEDGAPVSRARIALLPPDCTRICSERLFAFDGGKGAVVMAARGATYRVVVWSDSHAPLVRTVVASGDIALTLPTGGALDARLLDAERQPVRGAALEVQYRLPELAETVRRVATATADGTVALAGLPPSLVEWSAAASAFARRVDQASLSAAAVTRLGEIVLHPARQVRVLVRDDGGKAIAGAKVVVRGSSFAAADGNGLAVLRDLPAGESAVRISADGFLAADATIPKGERELIVTLSRGAAVKATLLRQADGQAPRRVRVRITNDGRQTLRTVDSADGFFLSGLRGGTVRLSIQSDDGQPYDTGTLQLAEGEVFDLGVVTLATGFSVRGTIVDDRSAPVGGARIRLLRTGGDSPALAHVLGNWTEVESAEDGTFRLTGLPSGSHFAVVEARGFAPRALPNLTVTGENTTFDAGTIVLEPGRTVDLVCRPEKRCGDEATILLAGAEYPFLALHTPLRQGRGRFHLVPSGTSTLRLTREQHVMHERNVTIQSGREAVALEVDLPSIRVHGDVVIGSRRARDGSLLFTRAVRSTGVPIMVNGTTEAGTTIDKQWLGSFGASTACALAPNGEFVADDLESGVYNVVFRSNGASTAAVRVEVPDVPEHYLPLRFEGAEIAGKVVDAANVPAMVRVEVVDAAGASHVASSGPDGEFRVLGVSSGRAHVKANGAGRKAEAEVDTDDAGARSVVLRLQDDPGSGLTVDVRDPDGSPAAGVLVFALANSGVIAASTDGEGRARLQGVSGNVPVAVHQPGRRWAFASGHAGQPARLVLPARPGMVVANCPVAAGEASIVAPNGFPLDRVLPMVGISSRIASGSALRVPGLPPGTYDVFLGTFRKAVTVNPGAVAEVRFGE